MMVAHWPEDFLSFADFAPPCSLWGFFLFGSLLEVSEYSPRHGFGAEERERWGQFEEIIFRENLRRGELTTASFMRRSGANYPIGSQLGESS